MNFIDLSGRLSIFRRSSFPPNQYPSFVEYCGGRSVKMEKGMEVQKKKKITDYRVQVNDWAGKKIYLGIEFKIFTQGFLLYVSGAFELETALRKMPARAVYGRAESQNLPLKFFFHQRSPSIEGCLPSRFIFH